MANSRFHHRIHRDLAVSVTGRSVQAEKAQQRRPDIRL
jgi:hypothetical protein